MRHQQSPQKRRDSKELLLVGDDCGISPAANVDNHRAPLPGTGPEAPDSREYLISMGDYDKAHVYDLYQTDFQTTTRPEQGHAAAFGSFAPHPSFPSEYAGPQAQVPSALPPHHATSIGMVHAGQPYHAPDAVYYGQQTGQYPTYLQAAPRPLPEDITWSPSDGEEGTTVTIFFESAYDFDIPTVTPVIMFGHKRCESELKKTGGHNGAYSYALSAQAPPLAVTNSQLPQVPVHLVLDDGSGSVAWQAPSVALGSFSYIGSGSSFLLDSPQMPPAQLQPRKRKLSPESSPRRSPTKKASLQDLRGSSAQPPSSPYRRPSAPEAMRMRRPSGIAGAQSPNYVPPVPRIPSYYASQVTPILHTSQSPSWSYTPSTHSARTPSAAISLSGIDRNMLATSGTSANPPLIRTSTLQPPSGMSMGSTGNANALLPYTMFPSNAKAGLEIPEDLDTMADKWTTEEWEAKRRLVQFRRNQNGSTITATFEPVTLESRIPNSICVSCIWWEERQQCYVTSVDTISLLESLVGVRFTVEEKNRIRRNLEGFRPETVSKTKADSEEFFKLIMGFPNPKPRNIEKDVKVFPWRVLGNALQKIIGKYASHPGRHMQAPVVPRSLTSSSQSASYASTASMIPNPSTSPYTVSRPEASPHSSTSSATSRGQAYTPMMGNTPYLGVGSSSSMMLPTSTATQQVPTSWHAAAGHYNTASSMNGTGRNNWMDYGGYLHAAPAPGLPGTNYSYPYQQRVPSQLSPSLGHSEATKFVPLQEYKHQQNQPSQTYISQQRPGSSS